MEELTLNDLTFRYSAKTAFSLTIESLSLARGEILYLHGRSGCGKTTLLNLISGVVPGTVATEVGEIFGTIAYVMHESTFLPWAKVYKNLHLEARLRRHAPDFSRFMSLCEEFDLPERVDDLYPSNLSLGMRQRLEIAKALAFSPDLLLLDEAFSGIDAGAKLQVVKAVRTWVSESRCAVIGTAHQLPDLLRLAQRICWIDKGEIVRQFPIGESLEARLRMSNHELLRLPIAETLMDGELA
jgi:ABC-type multidrug transport system ATPase subunit